MRRSLRLCLFAAVGFLTFQGCVTSHAAELLVKNGDKVAFLGDSITFQGSAAPGGYVRLVEAGLAQQGIKIQMILAGVPGNTSKDMLARLERDVLSRKPAVMTLSCGVNDVWHGDKGGIQLEPYKENIRAIVDQAQAAGIKVVILTSTQITEDPTAQFNQKLVAYNDFLRTLAKEKKLPLADLNTAEQNELKRLAAEKPFKGNMLTVDGVHPNPLGHEVMATGVLKAFGLSDEQLQQQHKAWLEMPDAGMVRLEIKITPRQFRTLQLMAADANQPIDAFLSGKFSREVQDIAAAHPQTP